MVSAEPPFLGWAVLTCQNWRWGSESGVEWASPPLRVACCAVLFFAESCIKRCGGAKGYAYSMLQYTWKLLYFVFLYFFCRRPGSPKMKPQQNNKNREQQNDDRQQHPQQPSSFAKVAIPSETGCTVWGGILAPTTHETTMLVMLQFLGFSMFFF